MDRRLTKTEWLKLNGFSQLEVTYIVLGNSYTIRNILKENGFKYSPLLRWHAPTADFELPEGCSYYELKYSDFFTWDEDQKVSFLLEDSRERLETLFAPVLSKNSQWIGEIGERLYDIQVVVKNISGYDTAYGYKYIYTFEDQNENVYTWFTSSHQPIGIDSVALLTGSIKAHVEYKGVRTNQLTRCRLLL